TTSHGRDLGTSTRSSTAQVTSSPSTASTTHVARRPAPSASNSRSPGRSRLTRAACRPSGPSSTTRSAPRCSVGTWNSGGVDTGRGAGPSAGERVAQLGEEALLPRLDLDLAPLAAQLGQLLEELALPLVEAVRRSE